MQWQNIWEKYKGGKVCFWLTLEGLVHIGRHDGRNRKEAVWSLHIHSHQRDKWMEVVSSLPHFLFFVQLRFWAHGVMQSIFRVGLLTFLNPDSPIENQAYSGLSSGDSGSCQVDSINHHNYSYVDVTRSLISKVFLVWTRDLEYARKAYYRTIPSPTLFAAYSIYQLWNNLKENTCKICFYRFQRYIIVLAVLFSFVFLFPFFFVS